LCGNLVTIQFYENGFQFRGNSAQGRVSTFSHSIQGYYTGNMKIYATLCFTVLFFHALAAQKRGPAAVGEIFAAHPSTVFQQHRLHFAQIRPVLTTLCRQYRAQTQREAAAQHYLVIVTLDGFRWQEIFAGADSLLLSDPVYTPDTAIYKDCYWAATPAQRRERLFPFLWTTIAGQGQLYGNRLVGNYVNVANKMWFSYPGYNEMFTGQPDDARIFTNIKLANPNENVLECLNRKQGFGNKVVAFSSWDAFPAILNEKRACMPVFSGNENRTKKTQQATLGYYQQRKAERGKPWPQKECFDALTQAAATEHLRNHHPRIAYIALGDTDEAAHAGHYDRYLDAARETDQWLGELWDFLQNDPTYRNRTTLLLTTDHGRGYETPRQWRRHRAGICGADQIWLAAIGPNTPPLGEIKQPMQLHQQQIASTIAQLVGSTFPARQAEVKAIETIFRKPAEARLITAKH